MQALVAVTAMLECNPFGDRLNAAALKASLATEQAKLNELLGITPEAAGMASASDLANAHGEAGAEAADASVEEEDILVAEEEGAVANKKQEATGEQKQPQEAGAEEGADDIANPSTAAITKAKVVTKYLTDAAAFALQMEAVIPIVCQLLASKSASDVVESISFVVAACHFGVDTAPAAARKMLMLMWSKDSNIKEAVMAAYKGLYLTPDPAVHTTTKARTATIVKNLLGITVGANIGEMTSMEEMVCAMVDNKTITSNALNLLWEVFSGRMAGTTSQQSRAALVVLTMAARQQLELIQDNVGLLLTVGLADDGADYLLVRDTCLALQRLAKPKAKKGDASGEPSRLPQDHQLFQAVRQAVTRPISGSDAGTLAFRGRLASLSWRHMRRKSPHSTTDTSVRADRLPLSPHTSPPSTGWMPACEQAINTIYLLAEQPDRLCGDILKGLSVAAFGGAAGGATTSASALTRLLFACGHIALKQLVHLV